MNKQTFWAIILSVLVMMIWGLFFNKNTSPSAQPVQTNVQNISQSQTQPETAVQPRKHIQPIVLSKGKKIIKKLDDLTISFDTVGAVVDTLSLNKYLNKDQSKINLVSINSDTVEKPFAAWLSADKELAFAQYRVLENTKDKIVFGYTTTGKYSLPAGLLIKKIY